MTTYENTWVTSLNRAPAVQTNTVDQTKFIAWYIKALLKNAGLGVASSAGAWTVEGSSSAAAYGMDGVDRWTDTFDASLLVPGGGAHSWIVLKSPVGLGPVYLCINLNVGNVDQFTITMARSAFSGGSLSSRPSSSTEMDFGVQTVVNSSNLGIKMHGSLASNGAFWIAESTDGSGLFVWALMHTKLSDARAGEASNGFTYQRGYTGGSALSRLAFSTAANWKSRTGDNSAAATSTPTFPCYNTGASNQGIFGLLTTADATDSKYLDFPAHMFTTTPGFISLRGRVADIFWAPDNTAQGAMEPIGGPYTGMVAGNLWLPVSTASAPTL